MEFQLDTEADYAEQAKRVFLKAGFGISDANNSLALDVAATVEGVDQGQEFH